MMWQKRRQTEDLYPSTSAAASSSHQTKPSSNDSSTFDTALSFHNKNVYNTTMISNNHNESISRVHAHSGRKVDSKSQVRIILTRQPQSQTQFNTTEALSQQQQQHQQTFQSEISRSHSSSRLQSSKQFTHRHSVSSAVLPIALTQKSTAKRQAHCNPIGLDEEGATTHAQSSSSTSSASYQDKSLQRSISVGKKRIGEAAQNAHQQQQSQLQEIESKRQQNIRNRLKETSSNGCTKSKSSQSLHVATVVNLMKQSEDHQVHSQQHQYLEATTFKHLQHEISPKSQSPPRRVKGQKSTSPSSDKNNKKSTLNRKLSANSIGSKAKLSSQTSNTTAHSLSVTHQKKHQPSNPPIPSSSQALLASQILANAYAAAHLSKATASDKLRNEEDRSTIHNNQKALTTSRTSYEEHLPSKHLNSTYNNHHIEDEKPVKITSASKDKELQRRGGNGLEFLNKFNESLVKEKLKVDKIRSTYEETTKQQRDENKHSGGIGSEEIRRFMALKKKQYENQNKKLIEQQKEKQHKLKENLQALDSEIKISRQKSAAAASSSSSTTSSAIDSVLFQKVRATLAATNNAHLNQAKLPYQQEPSYQQYHQQHSHDEKQHLQSSRSKSATRKPKSRTVSVTNLDKAATFMSVKPQINPSSFFEAHESSNTNHHDDHRIEQESHHSQSNNSSHFEMLTQEYKRLFEAEHLYNRRFSLNNSTSTSSNQRLAQNKKNQPSHTTTTAATRPIQKQQHLESSITKGKSTSLHQSNTQSSLTQQNNMRNIFNNLLQPNQKNKNNQPEKQQYQQQQQHLQQQFHSQTQQINSNSIYNHSFQQKHSQNDNHPPTKPPYNPYNQQLFYNPLQQSQQQQSNTSLIKQHQLFLQQQQQQQQTISNSKSVQNLHSHHIHQQHQQPQPQHQQVHASTFQQLLQHKAVYPSDEAKQSPASSYNSSRFQDTIVNTNFSKPTNQIKGKQLKQNLMIDINPQPEFTHNPKKKVTTKSEELREMFQMLNKRAAQIKENATQSFSRRIGNSELSPEPITSPQESSQQRDAYRFTQIREKDQVFKQHKQEQQRQEDDNQHIYHTHNNPSSLHHQPLSQNYLHEYPDNSSRMHSSHSSHGISSIKEKLELQQQIIHSPQNESNHEQQLPISYNAESQHYDYIQMYSSSARSNDPLYLLDFAELQRLQQALLFSESSIAAKNAEIETLTSQLVLFHEAAAMIQKHIRGYLTRKYIQAVLNYASSEEERLYLEAEKHLEENRIAPDELLDFPRPIADYIKSKSNSKQSIRSDEQELQLREINAEMRSLVTVREFEEPPQEIRIHHQGYDDDDDTDAQAATVTMTTKTNDDFFRLKEQQLEQPASSVVQWSEVMKQLAEFSSQNQHSQQYLSEGALKFIEYLQKQAGVHESMSRKNSNNNLNNLPIVHENEDYQQLPNCFQKQSTAKSEIIPMALLHQKSKSDTIPIELDETNQHDNPQAHLQQQMNHQVEGKTEKLFQEYLEQDRLGQIKASPNQLVYSDFSPQTSSQVKSVIVERSSVVSLLGEIPTPHLSQENAVENKRPKQTSSMSLPKKMPLMLDVESIERDYAKSMVQSHTVNEVLHSQTEEIQLATLHQQLSPQEPTLPVIAASTIVAGSGDTQSATMSQTHPLSSKYLDTFAIPSESMDEIVRSREEALVGRYNASMTLISRMHEKQRISPNSFQRKKIELSNRLSQEQERLQTAKNEIERGRYQFALTIQQTKRDLQFLEQTKRLEQSRLLTQSIENEESLRRLLSMRTETEHSVEEAIQRERVRSDFGDERNEVKIKIVDSYHQEGVQQHKRKGEEMNKEDALIDFIGSNKFTPKHSTIQQCFPSSKSSSGHIQISESLHLGSEKLPIDSEVFFTDQKEPKRRMSNVDYSENEDDKSIDFSVSSASRYDGSQIKQFGSISESALLSQQQQSNLLTTEKKQQVPTIQEENLSPLSSTSHNRIPDHYEEDSIYTKITRFDAAEREPLKLESIGKGAGEIIKANQSRLSEEEEEQQSEEPQKLSELLSDQQQSATKTESSPIPLPLPEIIPAAHENQNLELALQNPQEFDPEHLLETISYGSSENDSSQEANDEIKTMEEQLHLYTGGSNPTQTLEDSPVMSSVAAIFMDSVAQQVNESTNNCATQSTFAPGLECATLNFIKDFLVAFSEYITENFQEEFLERVNVPLGMDPCEFLKTFTVTEVVETIASSPNQSSKPVTQAPIYPIIKYIHLPRFVVSEELFAYFSDIFHRDRDQQHDDELQMLENYMMKMIYECFNEALDSMRPYGLKGKPLPWKTNSAKLAATIITHQNIEKILGLAIAKVLKWGSFLCGFIPERIESPTGELIQIDDDYLNQIKEDRLAQMLESDVIENEDQWLCYEDEETDVELELSDEIFNSLIEETARWLLSVGQPESSNSSIAASTVVLSLLPQTIFENKDTAVLPQSATVNSRVRQQNGRRVSVRPHRDISAFPTAENEALERRRKAKEALLKGLPVPVAPSNKSSLNTSF